MLDVLPAPAQLSTTPTLRVKLFGAPQLALNGQAVTLPRRQMRALFYRLASSAQPVAREHLCFLLWPDTPEATARRYLTVLLNQLRQALPIADLLVIQRDAILLNPARVDVDVTLFNRALSSVPIELTLAQVRQAVDLYEGPFLHGFTLPASPEFDDWADGERRSWERRYLDDLSLLVDGYASQGAYPQAIEAAQQVLAADELAEATHRRLIELYAATGDRTAALRQFERCMVVLERELGVSPLPETRAVYEAVRDGHFPFKESQASARAVGATIRGSTTHARRPATPARPAGATTLPAPTGPLIGRAAELAAVGALVQSANTRLVTLCGPGGSGKTRLGLQVAREVRDVFADGAIFVSLAPLQNHTQVIDAIAQACGLHEIRAVPVMDAVRAYLRGKHTLLVLDNFEHVLGAAPTVSELLAAAPGLHILVTSRTLLHVSGEHAHPLAPLPLPELGQLPPLDELAEQPAVALLLARAQAYTPSFRLSAANAADIAALCVHLEGLPLAIELAAVRLKILSPQALRKRLDHRLALLDQGPRDLPDRQRTLRATIDWSYRLLGWREQRVFERLSVFAGGWTLAAAEEVCAAGEHPQQALDSITALCDAHLVMQTSGPDGEPRFGMLETIREYALERLRDRADEASVRARHAQFYCGLVERCQPLMLSEDLLVALDELEYDHNNIRAALRWSADVGEHTVMARIASGLQEYWDTRGFIDEARDWTTRALEVVETLPSAFRAHLHAQAGFLAFRQSQAAEAMRLTAAVISDPKANPEDVSSAWNVAGLTALDAGDSAEARRCLEHALAVAEEHALERDVAGVQFNLGLVWLTAGKLQEADELFQLSGIRLRHPRFGGSISMVRGFIKLLHGDFLQAAVLIEDGLGQLGRVRNTTFQLYGLLACSSLAALGERPDCAVSLYSAAIYHADMRGLGLAPALRGMVDGIIEQVRSLIPSDEYDQAWQRGRSLTLDSALELAHSLLASVLDASASPA